MSHTVVFFLNDDERCEKNHWEDCMHWSCWRYANTEPLSLTSLIFLISLRKSQWNTHYFNLSCHFLVISCSLASSWAVSLFLRWCFYRLAISRICCMGEYVMQASRANPSPPSCVYHTRLHSLQENLGTRLRMLAVSWSLLPFLTLVLLTPRTKQFEKHRILLYSDHIDNAKLGPEVTLQGPLNLCKGRERLVSSLTR